MQLKKTILFVFLALILGACKSRNDITYMQNIENVALETAKKNAQLNLQPGDQLIIQVSGPDLDVVAPFNQNFSSSQIAQFGTSTGNNPPAVDTKLGPTYVVSDNGTIDFPIIGILKVQDLTVDQVQNELRVKITKYVKDPTVNVRLANFKVTVLGQVARPNQYMIPDTNATLLNALGMAGDTDIYGERTNILIIRTENGKITKQRLNITDADFINSPYYYLKQNDVIYVSPNKARIKSALFGPQTGIYISVASILVTILALVIRK